MEAKSIDCQKKSIFLVSVLPASKIEASDSQACEAFIAAIIWVKISTSAPSCVMVPANSTRAPPSSDSRRRNCGTNLEYEALGPAASAAATLRAAAFRHRLDFLEASGSALNSASEKIATEAVCAIAASAPRPGALPELLRATAVCASQAERAPRQAHLLRNLPRRTCARS